MRSAVVDRAREDLTLNRVWLREADDDFDICAGKRLRPEGKSGSLAKPPLRSVHVLSVRLGRHRRLPVCKWVSLVFGVAFMLMKCTETEDSVARSRSCTFVSSIDYELFTFV